MKNFFFQERRLISFVDVPSGAGFERRDQPQLRFSASVRFYNNQVVRASDHDANPDAVERIADTTNRLLESNQDTVLGRIRVNLPRLGSIVRLSPENRTSNGLTFDSSSGTLTVDPVVHPGIGGGRIDDQGRFVYQVPVPGPGSSTSVIVESENGIVIVVLHPATSGAAVVVSVHQPMFISRLGITRNPTSAINNLIDRRIKLAQSIEKLRKQTPEGTSVKIDQELKDLHDRLATLDVALVSAVQLETGTPDPTIDAGLNELMVRVETLLQGIPPTVQSRPPEAREGGGQVASLLIGSILQGLNFRFRTTLNVSVQGQGAPAASPIAAPEATPQGPQTGLDLVANTGETPASHMGRIADGIRQHYLQQDIQNIRVISDDARILVWRGDSLVPPDTNILRLIYGRDANGRAIFTREIRIEDRASVTSIILGEKLQDTVDQFLRDIPATPRSETPTVQEHGRFELPVFSEETPDAHAQRIVLAMSQYYANKPEFVELRFAAVGSQIRVWRGTSDIAPEAGSPNTITFTYGAPGANGLPNFVYSMNTGGSASITALNPAQSLQTVVEQFHTGSGSVQPTPVTPPEQPVSPLTTSEDLQRAHDQNQQLQDQIQGLQTGIENGQYSGNLQEILQRIQDIGNTIAENNRRLEEAERRMGLRP